MDDSLKNVSILQIVSCTKHMFESGLALYQPISELVVCQLLSGMTLYQLEKG